MSENVGASNSSNTEGLHGLYRDNFTFYFYPIIRTQAEHFLTASCKHIIRRKNKVNTLLCVKQYCFYIWLGSFMLVECSEFLKCNAIVSETVSGSIVKSSPSKFPVTEKSTVSSRIVRKRLDLTTSLRNSEFRVSSFTTSPLVWRNFYYPLHFQLSLPPNRLTWPIVSWFLWRRSSLLHLKTVSSNDIGICLLQYETPHEVQLINAKWGAT
jgi:hypothetical protein